MKVESLTNGTDARGGADTIIAKRMKISKKTVKALKAAKAKLVAKNAGKSVQSANKAASSKGAGKGKAAKKAAIVEKLIGERVALVTGAKGCAFRKGNLYSGGSFKLTQNNVGLKYDGAMVAKDSKDWDKQTRLELGNYIGERGERVKLTFLTLDEARRKANRTVKFERNGHTCMARVYSVSGKLDVQYLASVEMLGKNKTEHFFQLETERITGRNDLHFGEIISGDAKAK